MMLIESDKRGPEWAVPLAYADKEDAKFHVPENVHILGLMNTADRSLAMVDYALRRRFAFVDVGPGFGTPQFTAFIKQRGATDELAARIVRDMDALNQAIAQDRANRAGLLHRAQLLLHRHQRSGRDARMVRGRHRIRNPPAATGILV